MVLYVQRTERVGEDCGPVDWSHETAKDMPQEWRDAERRPDDFEWLEIGAFTARPIYRLRMWDGWPYWEPRPAVLIEGPLGAEWRHFNSYGVSPRTVRRK